MGEEKFASLTSGLLARKGGAKPAMRRQGYLNPAEFHEQQHHHEDLGWNDMGHHGEEQPLESGSLNGVHGEYEGLPAVLIQQQALSHDIGVPIEETAEEESPLAEASVEAEHELAEETPVLVPFVAPAPVRKAAVEREAGMVRARDKAAFTLRLDKDRHLKLRLAAAVSHRSAQNIVTEALDSFLAKMPELDGLTEQLPKAGNGH